MPKNKSTVFREHMCIRDATYADFKAIEKLLKSGTAHYFGPTKRTCKDAASFFKTFASHRLLVIDTSTLAVIGYAEFTNYPAIPALPKDCWMDWFRHRYCTQMPINVVNTLFFSYFIGSKTQLPKLLYNVLEECYLRDHKLIFIIAVQMPHALYACIEDQQHCYVLKKYSKILYPKEFSLKHCNNVQRLHIIQRHIIVNSIRSRTALPEDNDDIVEIIDIDRPDMRETLGDYFIAEELKQGDLKHNSVIVTEINNHTAGFIWLNDNVDIMRLTESYELEPFDNLMKFTTQQHSNQKVIEVSYLVRKDSCTLFSTNKIMNEVNEICQNSCVQISNCTLVGSKIFDTQDDSHSIDDERLDARRTLFDKCQAVSKLLTSMEHYIEMQTKSLHICYNVASSSRESSDVVYPLEEASDVFALHLMGMYNHVDLRRCFKFLAIAFSVFPDRDYCLISVPVDTPMTKTIHEILKYFIHIKPHANRKIDDNLYVTHRSSVYGEISLHPVRSVDIPEIDKMLQYHIRSSILLTERSFSPKRGDNLQNRAEYEARRVHQILQEVLSDPYSEYTFMTIRCGYAPKIVNDCILVGYVIVRNFTQLEFLQSQFKLTHYNNDLGVTCAEIITLRLHPFFHCEMDVLFRELARLTDFWHFYYIAPVRSSRKALTNDLITRMQPIEPHRIRSEVHRDFSVGKSKDGFNYAKANICLFQHNLCPEHFFGNTQSIVIIGFSDVCRAFLRLMVFSWNSGEFQNTEMHCCVPRLNITVIAPPGLVDAECDNDFQCAYCKDVSKCWINYQNSNCFIRDTVTRINLRNWVKFVSGTVRHIDKENHIVHLDTDCELYYNSLLLFCDNKNGPPKQQHAHFDLPQNYIHINNRLDKIILYHKLELMREELKQGKQLQIIIYGAHILAFEFVNFLITHDIDSSCITLVKPYKLEEAILLQTINNPYVDSNIERILHEMVEDLGVMVHERFLFSHWVLYIDNENISHVIFDNLYQDEQLKLNCDLFVSFCENSLDRKLSHVLRLADIRIRNNKILVDDEYRTSDYSILAFGRHIQHYDEPNHQYQYVSEMEAAEKIIYVLKLEIGELKEFENTEKFVKPVFFQAQLPMDYYFAKIILPKRYLANHIPNTAAMSTYYDNDFCRVGLNEHGIVEQILCVTKKDIRFDFLQYFVGKHEALLNNLRSNCYLNEIDSFLNFFQQPWTELIMHDHFGELQLKIRGLVTNTASGLLNMPLERNNRRTLFKRLLAESGITKQVEDIFLDFLREHRHDFKNSFALPEDFHTSQ